MVCRYQISLLSPVIGMGLKDVHLLQRWPWLYLQCIFSFLLLLQWQQRWSQQHIILCFSCLLLLFPVSAPLGRRNLCCVSQSVGDSEWWTLDWSLLSDCTLIINVLAVLSSHGQNYWPLTSPAEAHWWHQHTKGKVEQGRVILNNKLPFMVRLLPYFIILWCYMALIHTCLDFDRLRA